MGTAADEATAEISHAIRQLACGLVALKKRDSVAHLVDEIERAQWSLKRAKTAALRARDEKAYASA